MAFHTGSLDLTKLNSARRSVDNGEEGIFIPFAKNPCIYVGNKGIYLSIKIKPNKEQTYGQTHLVAADISKDMRSRLSKEEAYAATPILGGLRTYEEFYSNGAYKNGNQPQQRQTYSPYGGGQPQAPAPHATPIAAAPAPAATPDGMPKDLPF